MKTIELTQGQVALVDDEWYEFLCQYKWCAWFDEHTQSFYAATTVYHQNKQSYKTIQMHRLIMSVTDKKVQVDHKNHNTLDNRIENLRICDNAARAYDSAAKKYHGEYAYLNFPDAH